jgi:2-keto-4-pentenoate hydratase/2-oxohepta-3-ene-1,7-dioic acid hydratase in catechol pathway
MRIGRFSVGEAVAFGVVEGDPEATGGGAGVEAEVAFIAGHPFGPIEFTGQRAPLADVRVLAPVLPSKILAFGRNYAEHAREMGNEIPDFPVCFLKPSTSVIGPRESIAYPQQSHNVHHEAELAVVIGRLCRDVPAARVNEVILGYTCANDVSARDLQATDGQWGRAKGFDTFCPLGPWIETDLDIDDVEISCTVNGEERQHSSTALLLHKVEELVVWASAVMTLLPGDVLLTGTPEGVGPIEVGDEVSVSIEGIGTLTNGVIARD